MRTATTAIYGASRMHRDEFENRVVRHVEKLGKAELIDCLDKARTMRANVDREERPRLDFLINRTEIELIERSA